MGLDFESTVQARPQHHLDIATAHSIIDNTLAQVCNRKRRLSTPSLSSSNTTTTNHCAVDGGDVDTIFFNNPLKISKSDSHIMNKMRTSSSLTAPHGNGNVVMIVSDGACFVPSTSSPPTSLLDSSASSSSHSRNSSSSSTSSSSQSSSLQDMSPDSLIKSILMSHHDSSSTSADEEKGTTTTPLQPLHEHEFLHPTEEQIAAYNTHIIAAVRASDIYALRTMHNNGQTLGCCNRYGESILHMACRRSNPHVVAFLLKEAGVSPRIRDDHGRTPLHDACWRGTPEYSIVKLLLTAEPRLAFAKDVWGHTPFMYARREHWGAWNEFLDRNRDLILS
jgi:hypothetical protein